MGKNNNTISITISTTIIKMAKFFGLFILCCLIVSVCTFVTIVNNQKVVADPDGNYLVTTIDVLNDMHNNKLGASINSSLPAPTLPQQQKQPIVLTTITGEDAKKILNALEDGCCIDFRVIDIPDKDNHELVIQLIKIDNKKQIEEEML